jgi:GTP-binding protein LepA
MQHIRNFSIIAHIDHGKSTLADRIIQLCGGLAEREMEEQVLDSMELERERGITIKAQTAALQYLARDGQQYLLNLIDTPGHVDFSYEVSRSLAACEGAAVVDDFRASRPRPYTATPPPSGRGSDRCSIRWTCPRRADRVIAEIEEVVGILAGGAAGHAKTGKASPTLRGRHQPDLRPRRPDRALKALIIDSWFDNYVGVVMLVRVVDGELRPKDRILLMSTGATFQCDQVGVFTPKAKTKDALAAGEVGFVTAGIKELKAARGGHPRLAPPCRHGAARLRDITAGVCRPVSRGFERLRIAAGCP